MIKFDKEQCRKSRFPFVVLCKVPDTLRSPNYFWFERGGGVCSQFTNDRRSKTPENSGNA